MMAFILATDFDSIAYMSKMAFFFFGSFFFFFTPMAFFEYDTLLPQRGTNDLKITLSKEGTACTQYLPSDSPKLVVCVAKETTQYVDSVLCLVAQQGADCIKLYQSRCRLNESWQSFSQC